MNLINKKRLCLAILACVGGMASFGTIMAKNTEAGLAPELKESASYSLGARYAQAIKNDFGAELDLDQVFKGMGDAFGDKTLKYTDEEMQKHLMQLQQVRTARLEHQHQVKAEENLKASQDFLDENKSKEGVKITESGLQYKILKSGEGEKPNKESKVSVHYHGTLTNGEVFDSSVQRGTPATFAVGAVIPGWIEALQMMSVGDKWVIYVPADLAYGERGTPGGPIGPNETLIFEVELLGIES